MAIKKRAHAIEETEIPNVGIVKAGKVLEHHTFGIGTVVEIAEWESGDITINLNFKKYGSKWLVPEFADLTEPKIVPKKSSIFAKLFKRDTGNT